MSETRTFKYSLSLEWKGEVVVEADDGDDEEDVRDQALDAAIDEALSSPLGYDVHDYDLEDVTASA